MGLKVRFGLMKKFLFVALSLIFLGMAISTFFSYHRSKEALQESIVLQVTQRVDSTSKLIDSWVSDRKLDIGNWSEQKIFQMAVQDSFLGKSARSSVNAQLAKLKDQYGYYEEILLADTAGHVLSSSDPDFQDSIPLGDKDYYQQALLGESFMSRVMPSRKDGRPVFVISSPVRQNDTIAGVLLAILDLTYLTSHFVDSIKLGKTGYGFMFDLNGLVLAHPKKSNILKLNLNEFSFGKQIIAMPQGIIEYNYEGIEKLAAVSWHEKLGWSLAVTCAKSELYSPARKIGQTSLLVAIVVLLVASAVVILIVRKLVGPLREAVSLAETIRQGNFSARVQIRSKDEVGQLSMALNAMAETLSKTTVSKDYVENILKSMADALIVLDREGNIQRVNRVAPEMLGSREDDLLGKPVDSIIPKYRELHPQEHNPPRQGTVQNSEAFLLTANRKQVPISLSGSNLYDAEQQVIGTVLLAQDITERKKSEEAIWKKSCELERINKELDQFAYVVSHDLKAPLRAIANLSQWIEEDLEGSIDDDIREQLTLMRGRVARMEGLINGILEYSRIGRVENEVETVDVQALLEETIDMMPVPDGFTIDISQDMPRVTASRIRLGQVFANLLSNAIKYSHRQDGRVEITVEEMDAFYAFSVSDNGPGIDPEFHEKIFVIFQTLAARDKVESTGVGLTLIKKIIEEQGGAIGVESAEGQGASFRFTWPKPAKEEKAA